MTAQQTINNWNLAEILELSYTGYSEPVRVEDINIKVCGGTADALRKAIAGCFNAPPTRFYSSAGCRSDFFGAGSTNFAWVENVAQARIRTPNVTLGADQFIRSTSPFAISYTRLNAPDPGTEIHSVPEILLRLRAHFSLNTSELARVLGVERPTVYAWAKGTVEVRQSNRARLASLNRLMSFWTRLSPRPLGSLKHVNTGDNTVLDWLADSSASENAICEILRQVLGAAETAAPTTRSIAEIARQRGWTKGSMERTEQTVRSLRRKPGALSN